MTSAAPKRKPIASAKTSGPATGAAGTGAKGRVQLISMPATRTLTHPPPASTAAVAGASSSARSHPKAKSKAKGKSNGRGGKSKKSSGEVKVPVGVAAREATVPSAASDAAAAAAPEEEKAEGADSAGRGGGGKKKLKKIGFRKSITLIKQVEADAFIANHPECGMAKISIDRVALWNLQDMASHLVELIARNARSFLDRSSKSMLKKRDIEFSAKEIFAAHVDPDFFNTAVKSGNDAVKRFDATKITRPKAGERKGSAEAEEVASAAGTDGKRSGLSGKPKTRNPAGTRTRRAGTFFFLPRVEKEVAKYKFDCVSEAAMIFLCGLMDYTFICMINRAIKAMAPSRSSRIHSHHLTTAISNDKVLSKVFSSAIRDGRMLNDVPIGAFPKHQRNEIYSLGAEAYREAHAQYDRS